MPFMTGLTNEAAPFLASMAAPTKDSGRALELKTDSPMTDDVLMDEPPSEADRSASPSPPDTRPTTPTLTIAPCPVRFTSQIPPANYGSVVRDEIFRSGFPHARNIDFLEGLRLRSILTLVDGECSTEYQRYIREFGIEHRRIAIATNKEGRVNTTTDSLCEAITFLLNPINHPVYIHCNQGRHRTGCVVACLRKIQQWPLHEILAEYHTYASPKARPGDVALITAFDPAVLIDYIRSRTELRWWSRRLETLDDLFRLATAVLPPHESAQLRSASDKLQDWYRSGTAGSLAEQSFSSTASLSEDSEASSPASGAFTNSDGVVIVDFAMRGRPPPPSPPKSAPPLPPRIAPSAPEDSELSHSGDGDSSHSGDADASNSISTDSDPSLADQIASRDFAEVIRPASPVSSSSEPPGMRSPPPPPSRSRSHSPQSPVRRADETMASEYFSAAALPVFTARRADGLPAAPTARTVSSVGA